MATASPTSRTLKLLRDAGYQADVVERWIPKANVRRDLFGFIDVIAITNGAHPRTIGVQTTSASNLAARRKKVAELEEQSGIVSRLCAAGWELWLHGWRKNASGRWVCNKEPIEAPSPR